MQQDKIWDYFQNEGLQHGQFPEARQRFVLKHLRAGQKVLNIGVGSGHLERLALAKGTIIHALDPSERAIERLRAELGLSERAQAGYVQAIPFADESFDVVVMSEVLEHLDDEILKLGLAEVKRVLKPGGMLLATVPYQEELGANTVVFPDCGKVFHKVGHVQSFDRKKMTDLIQGAGLKTVQITVTTFIDWRRAGLRNLLKSTIRVFLARLGEGIGDPHLIARAQKVF
ncbi:MAG: class I SAM-dependent methyltransferase [Candidatus Lambdaproteobacteria bacterium]|nr:class I SAM-dependent methyltransferase [Candidatus Lambdaproteobacteria bacterium]